MNFWLSALIYNPLEAFILIYFCSIFTKIEIHKNIVKHCYLLGLVNLLIQYITFLLNNELLSFIYDLIVALVIMPLVLNTYIIVLYRKYIKFIVCIYSCIFNFITIFYFNCIMNNLNIILYNYNGYSSSIEELFVNICLRLIQSLFIFIIKRMILR